MWVQAREEFLGAGAVAGDDFAGGGVFDDAGGET